MQVGPGLAARLVLWQGVTMFDEEELKELAGDLAHHIGPPPTHGLKGVQAHQAPGRLQIGQPGNNQQTAIVQCENRHFYDHRKHTTCPYCGIPGMNNLPVEKTRVASLKQPPSDDGSTEPASPPRGPDLVRLGGNPNRAGVANVTVGMFQRQAKGVNPVTGWI
jgi:hypothetical protein